MPAISIVVPLYNKALYISRAINSISKQTFGDYEIIVVDDGSVDNGGSIVENINNPKVRLIRQENAGVSAARNKGIETARSELIAFLDADDEWLPTHLDSIIKLRDKYEAGIYATAYLIYAEEGWIEKPNYRRIPKPPWEGILPSYFKAAAYGAPPVWSSAACVPRTVFADVGVFKVGQRLGEDVDMWGRIAMKYPVALSRTPGAVYRKDAGNRSCAARFRRDQDPFAPLIEYIKRERNSAGVSEAMRSDMDKYVLRMNIETAKMKYRKRKYTDAISHLAGVSVSDPVLWYAFLDSMRNIL